MKTLKRGFLLRLMSVLLTMLMMFSAFSVSIVSTSAAEVDLEQTGASRTFAAGDYIYVKNFTPSGWSATWFYGDVYEWMHLYNSTTQAFIDVQFELVEGSENGSNAVYGAKVTTAGTYTHVVFTRSHSSTDFQGIGYTIVLVIMCVIREFLGSDSFGGGLLDPVKGLCLDGTGAGIQIFPAEFGASILTLPFGGFLTLGVLIAATQYLLRKSEEKKSKKEEVK